MLAHMQNGPNPHISPHITFLVRTSEFWSAHQAHISWIFCTSVKNNLCSDQKLARRLGAHQCTSDCCSSIIPHIRLHIRLLFQYNSTHEIAHQIAVRWCQECENVTPVNQNHNFHGLYRCVFRPSKWCQEYRKCDPSQAKPHFSYFGMIWFLAKHTALGVSKS